MLGINAKLIFNIGVFIDKKRDNMISDAKSIADNIIFLFLDIKNPPFFIPHKKRRELFFPLFLLAECENKLAN